MVFHGGAALWPQRLPRGAHPRSGAMLVLVQVSSMKTRRAGLIRSRYSSTVPVGVPRRGGPARWRSRFFFEAQLLSVDKLPHRAVVDLQAALGQFAHQTPQGKFAGPAPSNSQSLPPAIAFGGGRPSGRAHAAGLARRCTQLIAVLTPTPNCDAASVATIARRSTAAQRVTKIDRIGLPIHAGLHPQPAC